MLQQEDDSAEGLPRTSMVSACETITWIAFRRAIKQDDLGTLFKVTLSRWFCVPAATVLEALEARTGKSGDGPFCAIRKAATPVALDPYPSRHTIFTREGPAALRWIRKQHRRETGTLLSYTDLARLLREEIAFDESLSERIEDAKRELRGRVARGLLVAFGIPVRPDGSRAVGALVEALPATLFMNPAITLTEWDTVHADAIRPMKEWWDRKLPRFEDMQFRTAEVLALWPPQPATLDLSAVPESSHDSLRLAPIVALPISATETLRRLQLNSCTLTDAIGLIAYGDKYDRRYHAPPGDIWAEGEKLHRRKLDLFYPSNSGLPGFSYLTRLETDEKAAALAALERAADRRWSEAADKLLADLMVGQFHAFDEWGRAVPAEFWLTNNLRSPRARGFRFRADDLIAIGAMPTVTAVSHNPADRATAAPGGLPAKLASDPRAVAAFDEMCRFAKEHITSHGKPPKRDAAASAVNMKTTFPVRKARGLYRFLPDELRNPARTPRA